MLISEHFFLRLQYAGLLALKRVGDHLFECDFLEHIDLHEMREVAQRHGHANFIVGYQGDQIHANCNPDLGLHRIERITKEMLNRQILFQPFEEQLDLPALLVDGRDGECWQVQTVAQKTRSS